MRPQSLPTFNVICAALLTLCTSCAIFGAKKTEDESGVRIADYPGKECGFFTNVENGVHTGGSQCQDEAKWTTQFYAGEWTSGQRHGLGIVFAQIPPRNVKYGEAPPECGISIFKGGQEVATHTQGIKQGLRSKWKEDPEGWPADSESHSGTAGNIDFGTFRVLVQDCQPLVVGKWEHDRLVSTYRPDVKVPKHVHQDYVPAIFRGTSSGKAALLSVLVLAGGLKYLHDSICDADCKASVKDSTADQPDHDDIEKTPSDAGALAVGQEITPKNSRVIRGYIRYKSGKPRQVGLTARGDMNTQKTRTDIHGYFEVKTPSSTSCMTTVFVSGKKVWSGRTCSGDDPVVVITEQ